MYCTSAHTLSFMGLYSRATGHPSTHVVCTYTCSTNVCICTYCMYCMYSTVHTHSTSEKAHTGSAAPHRPAKLGCLCTGQWVLRTENQRVCERVERASSTTLPQVPTGSRHFQSQPGRSAAERAPKASRPKGSVSVAAEGEGAFFIRMRKKSHSKAQPLLSGTSSAAALAPPSVFQMWGSDLEKKKRK
ncbi:hypothetical protein IE53DRAFT_246467 [Violaceomyces palustris]|uniref:Uncharacterized protein n=1 Tax=Violaceomyces palustris TaxID=1673888 RepID=A0ACD0P458_9BASI|nr:hypothetical protein IE53DRAFT_246467 [Violaceomyces palustris]